MHAPPPRRIQSSPGPAPLLPHPRFGSRPASLPDPDVEIPRSTSAESAPAAAADYGANGHTGLGQMLVSELSDWPACSAATGLPGIGQGIDCSYLSAVDGPGGDSGARTSTNRPAGRQRTLPPSVDGGCQLDSLLPNAVADAESGASKAAEEPSQAAEEPSPEATEAAEVAKVEASRCTCDLAGPDGRIISCQPSAGLQIATRASLEPATEDESAIAGRLAQASCPPSAGLWLGPPLEGAVLPSPTAAGVRLLGRVFAV